MTEAFARRPPPLVESVGEALVNIGLPPTQVRTERFGPTGA
jgi:ferredoxin-NADP reductase